MMRPSSTAKKRHLLFVVSPKDSVSANRVYNSSMHPHNTIHHYPWITSKKKRSSYRARPNKTQRPANTRTHDNCNHQGKSRHAPYSGLPFHKILKRVYGWNYVDDSVSSRKHRKTKKRTHIHTQTHTTRTQCGTRVTIFPTALPKALELCTRMYKIDGCTWSLLIPRVMR